MVFGCKISFLAIYAVLSRNRFVTKSFCRKIVLSQNRFVPKPFFPKIVLSQNRFVPKSFCRRIVLSQNCFVAIYALLRGENLSQKLCPWRKNYKYEVCFQPPRIGNINALVHPFLTDFAILSPLSLTSCYSCC